MTRRQEWRFFWNLTCGSGILLCALPFVLASVRNPFVAIGAGGLLLALGLSQRWRLRRRRRRQQQV